MILNKVLPFFSYIFHPVLISVYAACFYFFSNPTYYADTEKYLAVTQVVCITLILPLLFFLLLQSIKQINSMIFVSIAERKIPFTLQCFLMILLVRKCITVEKFPEFHFFFLGSLTSTVIALFLLFFNIKASIHLLSISALTTFVIGLSIHNQVANVIWIAFFVLINGFVATSRLQMKAHTSNELLLGLFIGTVPQLALYPLWL